MFCDKFKRSPQNAIFERDVIHMNERQLEIAKTLFRNAANLSFGTVSVELKIHAGKCVGVIYTISENIRQKENGDGVLD
jgi:hypothetical protein